MTTSGMMESVLTDPNVLPMHMSSGPHPVPANAGQYYCQEVQGPIFPVIRSVCLFHQDTAINWTLLSEAHGETLGTFFSLFQTRVNTRAQSSGWCFMPKEKGDWYFTSDTSHHLHE
jgi:hypothetical protein